MLLSGVYHWLEISVQVDRRVWGFDQQLLVLSWFWRRRVEGLALLVQPHFAIPFFVYTIRRANMDWPSYWRMLHWEGNSASLFLVCVIDLGHPLVQLQATKRVATEIRCVSGSVVFGLDPCPDGVSNLLVWVQLSEYGQDVFVEGCWWPADALNWYDLAYILRCPKLCQMPAHVTEPWVWHCVLEDYGFVFEPMRSFAFPICDPFAFV